MRRGFTQRFALFTLVAWIAAAVGPALVAHGDFLDLACSDEAWASPHPAIQFENAQEPEGDIHCVVCHLQRAAREAFDERAGTVLVAGRVPGHPTLADLFFVLSLRAGTIPARAPPPVSL